MKTRRHSFLTVCLVLVSLVFPGCAVRNNRGYVEDASTADDGTVITRMSGKEITVAQREGKYKSNTLCYLDARRCQHPDGTVTYDLLLTMRWTDTGSLTSYEFLSTRESLTLVIDGKSVRLWPEGKASRKRDLMSSYITDSLIYPVSSGVLRDMAGASEVNVSIEGEGGKLDGVLSKRNRNAFKRFWEECGNPAGQSATQKP